MQYTKTLTLFLWMIVFLIAGCTIQNKQKVPDRFKDLKNLKVYSINQQQDTVHLQRQLVIGNTDKIPIDRLADIAVDSLGRIYIADGKQRNIQVYAPDGRFLMRLGRMGKGPGEFVNLISLQINNHKLFAYDNRLQRAEVFSLDSMAYAYTVNFAKDNSQIKNTGGSLKRFWPRSDDSFLIKLVKLTGSGNPVVGEKSVDKALYYLGNDSGKITSKKLFEMKASFHVIVPVGRGRVGFPAFFYGKLLTALSTDNHIYMAWSGDFLIKIYSPKGVYQRAIYYPFKNASFSRQAIADKFGKQAARKMDIPKIWPALHDLLIDDQNRLWVSTIVKDQSVYQWWVLDKNGKRLARFTWPRNKLIEVIKNGKVYTKEKNEKGIFKIVRYKIQMP